MKDRLTNLSHDETNNFVQLAVRKLRRPQKLGLDWREHENKMAAGGWGMEPFIQLSYNEQCPKKTAKLPEIALVNKGKVPECFWLALLERKCPEGAYTLCDLWRFLGDCNVGKSAQGLFVRLFKPAKISNKNSRYS